MTSKEFKDTYTKYFDSIRSYIYYRSNDGDLASDISQEVFMKIWNNKEKYDFKNIKSLLYKMANDNFISHYRKEKVQNKYFDHLKFNFKDESNNHNIEYLELKTVYENCLAQLDEKHRTVFLMSRTENLKYKEIAERLEISIKTVEKRMSQTLKELKTKLNVNDLS